MEKIVIFFKKFKRLAKNNLYISIVMLINICMVKMILINLMWSNQSKKMNDIFILLLNYVYVQIDQ
jgi:hypothetical protein